MKKEWVLAAATVLLTLVGALAAVRWLAPQLLGLPVDLQMVRVAREVPPFFEGVFRRDDFKNQDFIIADPIILRAKPLFPDLVGIGPNDLLGFRNRHVPAIADVIAIGDSQTYGNNAPLELNWPSQMRDRLPAGAEIYGMAVGGWCAVQYYEIFSKALYFRPRAVIVAFYSGNDALESFKLAYGDERWRELRPDPALSATDAPPVPFPPPENEQWSVTFPDGVKTVFTPQLRYLSNSAQPAVAAGYAIMLKTAQFMAELAQIAGTRLVFTIIPTKELVYADKIKRSGIALPAVYLTEIAAEQRNIDALAQKLAEIHTARYVDVLAPLRAATDRSDLYPADSNGHPLGGGYAAIGAALAASVSDVLPALPGGLVQVPVDQNRSEWRWLHDGHQWLVLDQAALRAAGWSEHHEYPTVTSRQLANVPYGDPQRGPGMPAAPAKAQPPLH